MAERVLKCPQCSAPVTPPSRFAKSVVCPYCATTVIIDTTVVSAARYRQALEAWNDPSLGGFKVWASMGDTAWTPVRQVATGELTDVYEACRARTPTERGLLKVLRDPGDAPLLEREVAAVQALATAAEHSGAMASLLPQLISHGPIRQGFREGARAVVYRWPTGFRHTLSQVRSAHPAGVNPRVATWMWRRALELLAFIHREGHAHGALLPQHLLIESGEHGLRFAGYSCAGREGDSLPRIQEGLESFYPPSMRQGHRIGARADLAMSARCMTYALGGDPQTGETPSQVPPPLAALLRAVADEAEAAEDAWALRERVGALAQEVFGPPSFHPVSMPQES
jgi:hypothetical protein